MRLVEIKFDQNYKPNEKEMSQVRDAWIYGQEPELNEEGEFKYTWGTCLIDLDRMPLIPFHIVRVIRADGPLGLDVEVQNRVTPINQKVNVAVPGFGLLMINDVRIETDCCTDALGRMMEEGWRILAICPQPDQRRPDYVLGRTKQEGKDDERK